MSYSDDCKMIKIDTESESFYPFKGEICPHCCSANTVMIEEATHQCLNCNLVFNVLKN